MDKFRNRVKYYLIGLGFGVLVVYFIFGNRGCSWLPENRVKNMIGEKEIVVSDSILNVMHCLELNNDDIYELLKESGNVDFSLSKTDGVPKIYYVEGEKEGTVYSAKFALYEEKELADVVAVNKTGANCSGSGSNDIYSTLPLPHNDVIAILESNEFRILTKAECDMDFYGISEEAIKAFHKTASIDIEASEPRLSPNPYYVMNGEIDGKMYDITYIVGENRTRISSVVGETESGCSDDM